MTTYVPRRSPVAFWMAYVTFQVGPSAGPKWSLGTARVTHVKRLSGQGLDETCVKSVAVAADGLAAGEPPGSPAGR